MKAKIVKDIPQFTPATIEITFETADDLAVFWHRMNTDANTVRKYAKKLETLHGENKPVFPDLVPSGSPVFRVVDMLCRKTGLL